MPDPWEMDWGGGGPLRVTVTPRSPQSADAIASIESGGNYRTIGPQTRGGDRAFGKYQVMGANVGPWTKEILGKELSPREFLLDQSAQDAVFNAKFGAYSDKYGPEGAARAWFAGEGGMNDPNRRDILGTSVADYSKKFTAAMGSGGGQTPQKAPWEMSWQGEPSAEPQQTETPKPAPAKPDVGRMGAFMSGLKSGATFNFGDELAGLSAAAVGGAPPAQSVKGPEPEPGTMQALMGLARLGYETLSGKKGDATAAYEQAVKAEREKSATAREQYPGTATAGEITGSLMLPIGGAAAPAGWAGRALRSAGIGMASGGLAGAGEGENLADRAGKAATGAAVGTIGGAVASPVMDLAARGIGTGVREAGRYLFPSVDARSARMIDNATRSAVQRDPTAQRRLTPAEVAANPEARIVDMAGEPGRAIARWAANASPEARDILNTMIDPRFEGQGHRIVGWLNNTFNFPNATAQSEALRLEARTINQARYRPAFEQNPGPMWDEALAGLAQDPVVQSAIRRASVSTRTERTLEGYRPLNNPFTFEESSGRLTLRRDPNGNPMYPDLQFWDQVKRRLDDLNTRESSAFARALREHLDDLTTNPETGQSAYQLARQGAAHFFGAENALEAGQNFARGGVQNDQARAALRGMTESQRQLFQDGFVSQFINGLGDVSRRRDVLNRINQSDNATEALNIALGANRTRELEAFLRVENVMNSLRQQVQGNSTTARQLVELGAVGTYGGVGAYMSDPQSMLQTAIAGAFVARGRNTDQRVARRVAEMLVSRDPAILQRGLMLVARNQGIMNAIRSVDQQIGRAAGQQGTGLAPSAISRAEGPQQQDVPGP